MSLGDRIKWIRKTLLGLNQTQFAKLLKLTTPAAVSNWEKNIRQPEIITLANIAKHGNVRLEWLATGEKPISLNEMNPPDLKEGITIYFTPDDIKTFDLLKEAPTAYPLLVESCYRRIKRQIAMRELDAVRKENLALSEKLNTQKPPGEVDDKQKGLEDELAELKRQLTEAREENERLRNSLGAAAIVSQAIENKSIKRKK